MKIGILRKKEKTLLSKYKSLRVHRRLKRNSCTIWTNLNSHIHHSNQMHTYFPLKMILNKVLQLLWLLYYFRILIGILHRQLEKLNLIDNHQETHQLLSKVILVCNIICTRIKILRINRSIISSSNNNNSSICMILLKTSKTNNVSKSTNKA